MSTITTSGGNHASSTAQGSGAEPAINCEKCGARCCRNPLAPILIPAEERAFEACSVLVRTPFRDMRVIPKREDGGCVFLDAADSVCTIYEQRPFECRIYPFLLDFEAAPDIQLDESVCPGLGSLRCDKEALFKLVDAHKWPEDWINAYETMDG